METYRELFERSADAILILEGDTFVDQALQCGVAHDDVEGPYAQWPGGHTYGGDFGRLRATFLEFLHHLPFYGLAVLCIEDDEVRGLLPEVTRRVVSYGFRPEADVRAIDVEQQGPTTSFKVQAEGLVEPLEITLNMPGRHNVLNALAAESNLSIISSPSLLVLNNQEASIQVGDEVPVATQERQSTIDPDAPLVSTVEYRDTGVLLNVKPRVNAGGLVIMEVEQEVSTVPSTADVDTLTPRIQTRKISSTVAVNSGDTIILGGLVEENLALSEAGIPGLHTVPVLGPLFGTKADNQSRTELLVLIYTLYKKDVPYDPDYYKQQLPGQKGSRQDTRPAYTG